MKEDQLKFMFSFTDEFGQLNEFKSTCEYLEEIGQFDLLVEKFVQFLKACGYSDELINEKIKQ